MAFSEEFYIRVDGEQKGPYTFPQLKQLYDKSFLAEETLYWREGMEQWEPVVDLCGVPAKQRKKRLRIRRAALGLIFMLLTGAITLAVVFFLPTIKEGWREMNSRQFTAQAAYWRARGFVRAELSKKNTSVSFGPLDHAKVTLSNGTDATVVLPGTIFPEVGSAAEVTWRVVMKYNPARKQWMLPGAEDLKKPPPQ